MRLFRHLSDTSFIGACKSFSFRFFYAASLAVLQPQSETRMTASVLQQLGDALCTVEPLLTPSPHRRLPLFGGLFFSHENSFFFSSTISHVPAWHGKNRMLLFSCLLKMSDFLMAKYIHIYMDVHKIEIYICLRVCVCVYLFSNTATVLQKQHNNHKISFTKMSSCLNILFPVNMPCHEPFLK